MNDANIHKIVTVLYNLRWPLLALIVVIIACLLWLCFSIIRNRKHQRQHEKTQSQAEEAQQQLLAKRLKSLAEGFQTQSGRVSERLRTYQNLCGQDFIIKDLIPFDQRSFQRALRKELPSFQSLMAKADTGRLIGLATHLATELERRRGRLARFGSEFSPNYKTIVQQFYQHVAMLGQLNDQLSALAVKELDSTMRVWANAYLSIFGEWKAAGSDASVAEVKKQLIEPIHALGSLTKTNPFVDQTERLAKDALQLVRRLELEDIKAERIMRGYASGQSHAARFCQLLATGLLENQEARPQDAKRVKETGSPDGEAKSGATALQKWWSRTRRSPKRWLSYVLLLALVPVAIVLYRSYSNQKAEPKPEPSYHTGHALPLAPDDDDYDSIEEHLTDLQDQRKTFLALQAADTTSTDSVSPALFHDLVTPEYGVDISHYQGNINWGEFHYDTLPSPLTFVIMKASQGTKLDSKFRQNWNAVDTTKAHRGAYHFFSFRVDPLKQANFYIANVPLGPGSLRPIVDVEAYGSPDPLSTGPLTPVQLRSRLQTFLDAIERHYGVKAIIYSGNYYYKKHLKGYFPNNDFWLAQYSKSKQAKARMEDIVNGDKVANAIMWQFSSTGSVAGIKGDVDLNYLPARYSERVLIPSGD